MRATLAAAALAVLLNAGTASTSWAQAATPDPHQGHGAAGNPPPPPAGPGAPQGMAGGHHRMMDEMPGMMGRGPGKEGEHHRMMRGMMRRMMEGEAGGHGGMAMDDGPTDPVAGAFEAINRRMHKEMMPAAGLSPDAAFVTGMIPHHEGAIDMAKVVLAFGADPEIKKLAQAIIAAQAEEIAFMRAWLAKQPR